MRRGFSHGRGASRITTKMMSEREEGGMGWGENEGKKASTVQEQQQTAGDDAAMRELPGASLGSGTRWGLSKAVEKDSAEWRRVEDKFSSPGADEDVAMLCTELSRLRMRCGAILEQALSGSKHGDVAFRFQDGRSPFTGHRSVLCKVSEEYAGMFRSGMLEEQTGIIGVPPGVSEPAYRGLLECVYLEESEWVLVLEETRMRGVGKEAVKRLALTRAKQGSDGRRLGWRCVRDAVHILQGWARANGVGDSNWLRDSMHELDYTGMPVKVLRDVVGGCGHVDVEWADGVVERMLAVSGGNVYETEYKIVREYEFQAYEIALDGKGYEQRMAVTHYGSELNYYG